MLLPLCICILKDATNVYWYIERHSVTWYLIPIVDGDSGVDPVLLEAVGVSKIGADDVVGSTWIHQYEDACTVEQRI